MSKGKIIPVPWWLWNLFWILRLLGSYNWFEALAAAIMLGLGYSITHIQER